LSGDYFVGHDFGWTDFKIDALTGELLVTTFGVPSYTAADLSTNAAAILAQTPTIVSQFKVTPSSDSIIGTARGDDLYGTSGADVILGAAGNDELKGREGDDYLDGGEGRDIVFGGAGADRLFGRDGNDQLNGEAGDDRLQGGSGNDTLDGGLGNDTFVFEPDFDKETIIGFDANPAGGQDFLDVHAFGPTGADFGVVPGATRVVISDVGADTLVTIDGSETIRLVGIGNAATVTQADFLL
jgi:Ca2+-binding RTX toxin-like protein